MAENANLDMIGREVHYVLGDGGHANAEIGSVQNDREVVGLLVDGENGTYKRRTVAYRKEPVPYSWHWPEDDVNED